MEAYRIEHYLTVDGRKDIYIDWLRRLRDTRAKVAIIRHVARIEQAISATTSIAVMACGNCAST